jgi:hypothetical protein
MTDYEFHENLPWIIAISTCIGTVLGGLIIAIAAALILIIIRSKNAH